MSDTGAPEQPGSYYTPPLEPVIRPRSRLALQGYLLRLDDTGTPSYVGRGDSPSRPYTLGREAIGVGTSISSILNSHLQGFLVA